MKRLLEEDDAVEGSEEKLLLRSARGDGPSTRSRARVAVALGLSTAIVTTTATSTTSAAVAKAAGSGLWLKIVGAAAVTAAVGGGTVAIVRHNNNDNDPAAPVGATSSTATAAAKTATSSNSRPVVTEALPPPPPLTPVVVVTDSKQPASKTHLTTPATVTTPTTSAPTSTSRSTSATSHPAPPGLGLPGPSHTSDPPSSLTEELQMLGRATGALDRGDAKGALSALDDYDRAFPEGAMRNEAAVARAEALQAKGDKTAAQKLARDLLRRDPSQPHAKRLRSIAGD